MPESLFKYRVCNFIKKEVLHSCFPVKFAELLRTFLFIEHLRVAASLLTFMIIILNFYEGQAQA